MRVIVISLVLLAGIVGLTIAEEASDEEASDAKENLTVGALLPMSGEVSNFGSSDIIGLRMAQEDIKNFLSSTKRDLQLNVIFKDTKSDPKMTLFALKDLQSQGIKIIIGPDDSASLKEVREYALQNGIILISPSSTAPGLAMSNDTIFRLAPDDRHMAKAVSALMQHDGIKAVVVLARNDTWADELINATRSEFAARGGTFYGEVRYDPGSKDFSDKLDELRLGLNDILMYYDSSNVAVFMASFNEGCEILKRAANDPMLSSLRWYSGDNSGIPSSEDPQVAESAVAVDFVYPMYGDERSEIYQEIKTTAWRDPNPYSVNAYDALWLIVSTYLQANSDDPDAMLQLLPLVADSRMGSCGSLALNDAGDRDAASYAFMSLDSINGSLQWAPRARYIQEYGNGEKLITVQRPGKDAPQKAMIINSYHPGWALEDDLVSGIQSGLEREGFSAGKDYQIKVFWMDTKVNHTTQEEIEAQGEKALSLIDEWKPNIVFVNNDNALKHVAVAYAENNPESRLPFIFAGTNIDPSIYAPVGSLEHPAGMITGTLERLPFETAFAEAKKILPKAEQILLLSDASPSSLDAKREFEAWYALHRNESPLQVVDFVQTNDFREWKRTVESYQNRVDMIGFIGYQQVKDADGRVLSAMEVASWTVENSDLPELDLIPTDARYGMLMGAGISYYKTGIYGGIVGGKVLKGAAPGQFPIVDPKVTELTFNRQRAEDLNVTIPVGSLILADEVYG